jgi:hypothetical protein
VSFEDAARATSTQVRDLVHYVEQSNPNLVEELSTALSLKDGDVFVPLAHDLLQKSHPVFHPPRGRT